MSAPVAVFAAAAGPEIGGGHAMRCLTLAAELERVGWRARFVATTEAIHTVPALGLRECATVAALGDAFAVKDAVGRCDLLVVDDYGLDARFESACRAFADRILAIDDLANRDHDCDFLLDQNLGASAESYRGRVPGDCVLMTGTGYALLRPEFLRARPQALARRRQAHLPTRLLVSCGATDSANVTERAVLGARRSGLGIVVDVVLGPGAPHLDRIVALAGDAKDVHVRVGVGDMAALMAAADVAIGAAGTSAWERCCLGLPGLVAVLADNQRANADALAKAGAVDLLGWHANIDETSVAAGLSALWRDVDRLGRMADAAAAVCDGHGARRAAAVLAGKE